MKLLNEFREFAIRGNVIDMAVGIIIGAAFGKIVTSLVNDVIMPPIGLLMGQADFSSLIIPLKGSAVAGDLVAVRYGLFINTVIDFVIVAFAIFLLVQQVNRLKRAAPPKDAGLKECPRCCSSISLRATRCPNCTSELATA